jgi:hypothetical protein
MPLCDRRASGILTCHDGGRPTSGKSLYFGKIAAAVLENSQHSILLGSS